MLANWPEIELLSSNKFTRAEFQCRCGCGAASMDHEYMLRMVRLRLDFGAPIIVNSGYRCPDYNTKVSNSGRNGPHTTGRAGDYSVSFHRSMPFTRLAMKAFPTPLGFGPKQHGESRFFHLDNLKERIWTYKD